jgi:hypothetical protein
MASILPPFVIEVALITYRDIKKGATNNIGGLPLPADFLAAFGFFALLGFPTGEARKFTIPLAWAFVGATALNLFDPSNPTAKPGSSPTTPTSVTSTKGASK